MILSTAALYVKTSSCKCQETSILDRLFQIKRDRFSHMPNMGCRLILFETHFENSKTVSRKYFITFQAAVLRCPGNQKLKTAFR